MPELHVIAVTGRARSGKDSTASFLVAHHGFHRIALADGVRSAFVDLSGPTWELHKDLDDTFGVRKALQVLGTEARLGVNAERLWVDLLLAKIRYASRHHPVARHRFVIPDMRFPYEREWIKGSIEGDGGRLECWKVERPGLAIIAEAGHSSETMIESIPVNRTITNAGSLDDLSRQVTATMGANFVL